MGGTKCRPVHCRTNFCNLRRYRAAFCCPAPNFAKASSDKPPATLQVFLGQGEVRAKDFFGCNLFGKKVALRADVPILYNHTLSEIERCFLLQIKEGRPESALKLGIGVAQRKLPALNGGIYVTKPSPPTVLHPSRQPFPKTGYRKAKKQKRQNS